MTYDVLLVYAAAPVSHLFTLAMITLIGAQTLGLGTGRCARTAPKSPRHLSHPLEHLRHDVVLRP